MQRSRLLYVVLCVASLAVVTCLNDATLAAFLDEAAREEQWLISTRRELHQWPELMYQEHNTSRFLRSVLDDLDIPYK